MNLLKCEEVKSALVEYLEFELPLARREQFYEHLMACDDCRIVHDDMQDVLIKLKYDDMVQPTQDYWDSLADNVLEEVRQQRGSAPLAGGKRNQDKERYKGHEVSHDPMSNVIAFNPLPQHRHPQQQTPLHEQLSQHDQGHASSPRQHTPLRDVHPSQRATPVTDRHPMTGDAVTPLTRHWARVILPAAAALLIGLAAVFSLLEKPQQVRLAGGLTLQDEISSDQPLAYLVQHIAPLSQSGNQFGFSSQAVLFNSFSIGSLFSEARALATVNDVTPLKTQLALLKTALIRETTPKPSVIAGIEELQRQLSAATAIAGVRAQLDVLFEDYVSQARSHSQKSYQLATAGQWLFDYALVALAGDGALLRQVEQLRAYDTALQSIGVPPGVGRSFARLIEIAQQVQLTQRDYRQVVREIENIRSLLG